MQALLTRFNDGVITPEEFHAKVGALTYAELRILSGLLVESWRGTQARPDRTE